MNRYRDIASSLIRHGFGFIVEEIDAFQVLSLPMRWLRKQAEQPQKKSVGERLRYVIQDLGPTFVKLGQIASTRSDVLPEEMISQLELLQDQVAPFPFYQVRDIIESELAMPIEAIFDRLEQQPLASASIGQVHAGTLISGEHVAVKIQRPSIAEAIRTDLEILQNLAAMAEHRFEWARRYQLRDMMKEFGKSLLNELDYSIEGRSAEKIARQFAHDNEIYIPAVYWDFSTRKVLVMEYAEGIKVSHTDKLVEHGYDLKRIAKKLLNAVLQQIFIDGTFHADPHPGNVMVMRGERIGFIDFGMVGRLTPEMKSHFSGLIIAMMRQSTDGVMKSLLRLGLVTDNVNKAQLHHDISELREKYYGIAFSQVRLGEAVNDLLDTAFRHQMRIPADLILLGKALLTVEGVVQRLDPDISIVKLAEPIGRRLLFERLNPKQIGQGLWRDLTDFADFVLHFPNQVKELMNVVKNGQTQVEIRVPELDSFTRKLERISNRLSFSVVMLSFSILMTGLIIGSSFSRKPAWNIPAVEAGVVIVLILFIGLLFSLFKSGKY